METIRESNRIGAGAEGRKRDILKIGIIVGSTWPGRNAVAVAKWARYPGKPQGRRISDRCEKPWGVFSVPAVRL